MQDVDGRNTGVPLERVVGDPGRYRSLRKDQVTNFVCHNLSVDHRGTIVLGSTTRTSYLGTVNVQTDRVYGDFIYYVSVRSKTTSLLNLVRDPSITGSGESMGVGV